MEVHKLEEKKHDMRTKGMKGDLSDTGIVNDQLASNMLDNQEDSFQKMYSKELDLDEDEVPIILHELNDSAIHFISRDQYERALSLLQKAQTLIDRLQFQKNPNDRLMVFLTMHNMALCFQKLGALEECALCLEASLQTLNSPFLLPKFSGDPAKKLKRLKYECKAHMQVCALLSQLHRHKDALIHAEKSVQVAQYMINDLLQLCQIYFQRVLVAKRNEQIAQELLQNNAAFDQQNLNGDPSGGESSQNGLRDLIYYDDSVSMLERTAYRIFPIIQDCASRMIKSDQSSEEDIKRLAVAQALLSNDLMKPKLNMKAVLGYLNQSEWLYLLNIGNIMQITPLTVHDLYSNATIEVELTRDSVLEKISFLAVSYFCISTELRFLVQIKDDPAIDPARKKKESEFWHAKALEIAVSFLPSECPLVTHILTSYQKHHAPVQQEIPEDQEANQGLKVIRPLAGIDISKFQPLVRQDESLNIAMPQLPLSPNNYGMRRTAAAPNSSGLLSSNLVSRPFSPNNNITQVQTQITSTNNIQKMTDTTTSQQNIISSQTSTRQQQHAAQQQSNYQHQRFLQNKNQAANGAGSKQQQVVTKKQNLRSKISKKWGKNGQQDISEDFIQGTDPEEQQQDIDMGNKSMMEVVPSSNYKKLLQDFSNIQNSSGILQEEDDDEIEEDETQFFELDDGTGAPIGTQGAMHHQESTEVEMVFEKASHKRKERRLPNTNSAGIMRRQYNTQGNQVLDISQDILDDDEDQDEEQDDEEDSEGKDDDAMDGDEIIDDGGRGTFHGQVQEDEEDDGEDSLGDGLHDHERSFQVGTSQMLSKHQRNSGKETKHNLSLDGQKIKRPKTSQGIRKQKQLLQMQMEKKDKSGAVKTQSQAQARLDAAQQNNFGRLNQNSSGAQLDNSDDRISPLHSKGRHNQSMAAGGIGQRSKLGLGSLGSGGPEGNQTLNGINTVAPGSGAITDLKGNSTPNKSNSMAISGYKFKNNRDLNSNLSRGANMDQLKTNQSSNSELMQLGVKRSNSKQQSKRHRNQQDSQTQPSSSLGKRNTVQQQQQTQPVQATQSHQTGQQRSLSQQKQKYLSGSAGKTKYNDFQSQQISHHQLPINDNARKTMNDVFMVDRMMKKRGAGPVGHNTQEQPGKTFDIPQSSDPKYRSQHFGSQSRSKSRGKTTSSRSKEKLKLKSTGDNNQTLEELKRQILLKQTFLDSGNSRRKSGGGASSGGAGGAQNAANLSMQNSSQQQIQTNYSKKKAKNIQRLVNAQQLLQANNNPQQQQNISGTQLMSSSQQQQWFSHQGNLTKLQQQQMQLQQQKMNTHQMIKKFLKERQLSNNTSSSLGSSSFNLNGSLVENYTGVFQPQASQLGQQQQMQTQVLDPQSQSYKLQLSKKILQQQQKLIMGQQMQGSSYLAQDNSNPMLILQPSKQSKRSPTPIAEYNEKPAALAKSILAQPNAVMVYPSASGDFSNQYHGSGAREGAKDKSLVDIGNVQKNKSLNMIMRDYASVQDCSGGLGVIGTGGNQSLREDSLAKSVKKKSQKKATPKNMLAGGQFSWL